MFFFQEILSIGSLSYRFFCNWGAKDVSHDLLCLNVFECLLFIQKCRYKKEKHFQMSDASCLL